MKAYKMFEYDWTCRGFQYKVGETYEYDGEISLCSSGFHACKNLQDCFKYYDCCQYNKIAEVELLCKILREHGFDTSFYKEDIRDNEYILISSLQNKRESAIKNLQRLFLGKYESKSQSIIDSVDEFINNIKEK